MIDVYSTVTTTLKGPHASPSFRFCKLTHTDIVPLIDKSVDFS